MTKKQGGRFRKASVARESFSDDTSCFGCAERARSRLSSSANGQGQQQQHHQQLSAVKSDDRKMYAGKVRSLIEKKYRTVGSLKRNDALKGVLAQQYPKSSSKKVDDLEEEDIYESNKLNVRRMVAKLGKTACDHSDIDSWADLEEHFSQLYEVIPGRNHLEGPGQWDIERSISSGRYANISLNVDDADLTLERVKNFRNRLKAPSELIQDQNRTVTLMSARASRLPEEVSWNSTLCSTCSGSCSSWWDSCSYASNCSSCRGRVRVKSQNGTLQKTPQGKDAQEMSFEPVPPQRVFWTTRIKRLRTRLRCLSAKSPLESLGSWEDDVPNTEQVPSSGHVSFIKKRVKDTKKRSTFVNLGLIYVPIDEEQRKVVGYSEIYAGPSSNSCSLPGSNGTTDGNRGTPSTCVFQDVQGDGDLGSDMASDSLDQVDPFGSLESVIFEPKDSAFGGDDRRTSDADGSKEELKLEELGTLSGPTPARKTMSISECGNYWDWGKKERADGTDDPARTVEEGTPKSQLDVNGATSNESECYPPTRTSTFSECKTCAGTSVASWTYIGIKPNGVSRNPNDPEEPGNNNRVVPDSSSKVTKRVPPVPPPKPAKKVQACANNSASVTSSASSPPSDSKKTVTWKLLSDQKSSSGSSSSTLSSTSTLTSDRTVTSDFCDEEPCDTSEYMPGIGDCFYPPLDAYRCWSDMESFIFGENVSLKSFPVTSSATEATSRMSCYRDQVLFWEQQKKQRKKNGDGCHAETWRNKAKRMLLWMHHANDRDESGQLNWSWWKAKQRSSILWLISKANGNKVPEDLKNPYYKDHEDQDQLKPVIVHALASAEYYCLALGIIYADPNYHNLNHWSVIQALARKGVYVAEPSDVALTETVLIQTSPIRMSAHMAVIEAIMALYLKETVTVDRIMHAVRRLVHFTGSIELPNDIEDALTFWVNKVCIKMRHRIEDELSINSPEVQMEESVGDGTKGSHVTKGIEVDETCEAASKKFERSVSVERPTSLETKPQVKESTSQLATDDQKSSDGRDRVAPPIPVLQDLGDLSDGCCLTALVSYYCPFVFRWQEICLNEPMSMADSLYNLQLLQRFCKEHLPYDPCFLTLEDLVYQHSSVRHNILVFLADLFYLFEVRPAKCVRPSSSKQDISSSEGVNVSHRNGHSPPLVSNATKRSFQQPISPIPDLRNSSADSNRISPKSQLASTPSREALLPRRQNQDRAKRFSLTEGTRVTPSASGDYAIRHQPRSDFDHNGAERPFAEESQRSEGQRYMTELSVDLEPNSSAVKHRLRGTTSTSDVTSIDDGDIYLRPTVARPESRPLLSESPPEKHFSPSSSDTNRTRSHSVIPTAGLPSTKRSTEEYFGGRKRPETLINATRDTNRPHRDISPEAKFHLSSSKYIISPSSDSKECPESLGSSESGVFLERDTRPPSEMTFTGNTTSFAQLSKQGGGTGAGTGTGITIVYMQHEGQGGAQDGGGGGGRNQPKSGFLQKKGDKHDKKTSFAALPNQTSWQQKGQLHRSGGSSQGDSGHETPTEDSGGQPLSAQISDVRLKLEDKRRRIESEKRKMELMASRVRQKVGKTAFLQAVAKGVGKGAEGGREHNGNKQTPDSGHPYTMDEIAKELDSVQHRWLDRTASAASGRNGAAFDEGPDREDEPRSGSPDPDSINLEEYGRSLERLNTNLSDLQSDIDRLSKQQEQIQRIVHDTVSHPPETQNVSPTTFYLHDQPLQQQQHQQPHVPEGQFYGSHPLRRSASRDQLQSVFQQQQQQPLQRSASREQLYAVAASPLRKSMSREQLYTGPSPLQPIQTLQRSVSREQLYAVQQPLQRTMSREQLYMPPMAPNMQRSMSREQLYPMAPVQAPPPMARAQWGPPVVLSDMQYPPQMDMPQYYVDPSGYLVHQPYPAPQYVYSNGPEGYGSPYVHHQQYAPPQEMYTGHSPFRLHVDVQGPPPQSQPPRSHSPMNYHQPRPSSRPPSAPAGVSPSGPLGLPSKAVPVRAPPEDAMEPQSVHFIEAERGVSRGRLAAEEDPEDVDSPPRSLLAMENLSGTATYRVREPSSPTRPTLGKTFRVMKPKVLSQSHVPNMAPQVLHSPDSDEATSSSASGQEGAEGRGFFVTFEEEGPRRPKPEFRANKVPKVVPTPAMAAGGSKATWQLEQNQVVEPSRGHRRSSSPSQSDVSGEELSGRKVDAVKVESPAVVFSIGEEMSSADELERRRQRKLLNAMKRKDELEELLARKEAESSHRRERERLKQESAERKKEEDRARRQAIYEQYKQRKAAMEEDGGEKVDSPKTATLTKKPKPPLKPRPKSLYEMGAAAAEARAATLASASVGRGSQLNLAGNDSGGYYNNDGGGRSTPPRRVPSPGQMASNLRHPSSPTSYGGGPSSLPPGLVSRRVGVLFNDAASDTCSTTSSAIEYTGPKLFKKPTEKSNRGIIVNAINSVLAGAVNSDTKKRCLEEISKCDSKHFLILFRDSGCQFRALYMYMPEREEVIKLFGTGPKQVTEKMMDKYYKYNCGGRNFTEIQTKHLTVTIDAFTIHNTLWQGKKIVPVKKDALY